jgi:molybdopterin/thiamine biosynthesis adenylyltransferase
VHRLGPPANGVELRIDGDRADELRAHLFQDDNDEHAAVALAGIAEMDDRLVLLVRELHLIEAADFGPGEFGYRQTSPRRVAELSLRAADEKLAYIALHSHPGASTSVGLSRDDLEGHKRLFPHLLDIVGEPVAGLALGEHAAAGEVWLPNGETRAISQLRVVGRGLEYQRPIARAVPRSKDERFDRQARLFGAEGQAILADLHVAVVGAGGGGSIIVEQLAHLGIGRLTIIDFDVVKDINLSRIVGATPADAARHEKKVVVLQRLVERIDPTIRCDVIPGDISDEGVATALRDCDFIFLATDTTTSRLVLNAVVHRFLVPAVQIGAKVEISPSGDAEVYVAVRPVLPHQGCLHCASLIDPIRLREEGRTEEERVAQNYLDIPEVVDPSVISLNGIAASHAVTTMLLWATGLLEDAALRHTLFFPRRGEALVVNTQRKPECPFCSASEFSIYARGGAARDLPVRRMRTQEIAALDEPSRWVRFLRWTSLPFARIQRG